MNKWTQLLSFNFSLLTFFFLQPSQNIASDSARRGQDRARAARRHPGRRGGAPVATRLWQLAREETGTHGAIRWRGELPGWSTHGELAGGTMVAGAARPWALIADFRADASN
uniref:DUF834 domain-containing protein n=1 Tax=Oryza meridionalis TaxID=40149 RepID=A0A0E0EWS5_9ORYZ